MAELWCKTCVSHRGFSLPSFETRSALKLLQVEHFHKMITHLHTMKFHLRSWYELWSMQLVSCPVKLDRVDVVLLCLAQPTQKESHSAGYTCIVNVVVFQIGCYSCKAPTRESIAPRKKLFLAKPCGNTKSLENKLKTYFFEKFDLLNYAKSNIHISSNTFWGIKLLPDPSMKKKRAWVTVGSRCLRSKHVLLWSYFK